MNLGSQTLVNKQSIMPSTSGASRNSTGAGDQFPAGLRVLVVDDDPTCLMILENMLRNCKYEVTKCNRAEVALSLLRENKNGFDVVISDVHMPDMDGFKLLEHIGLEMDLPVIMMSADDSKSVVMKGVTHGACDYLIKPVRIEALRNIWQHVVRKRKHEWKDVDPSPSFEKQPEDPDYSSSANEGHNWKSAKRRKADENEAEGETEAEAEDDSSSLKKPRVVWSVELHQQFVAAVNQLGIDKAVPKKILDLMNVPGLTRENVASHLQKYRLYLRRLSGSHQSGGSFMGNPDGGFGSMSSLGELDLQALAASGQLNHLPAQSLATLQAAAALGGRSTNSKSPVNVPLIDQRNIFSFENPKFKYGHSGNLLHGIPTTMEPKQLVGLQNSFGGLNSQRLIPMNGQSQSQGLIPVNSQSQSQGLILLNGQSQGLIPLNGQSQTHNHVSRQPVLPNGNGFPLRGSLGISSASVIQRDGFVPSYDIFNDLNQNRSNDWGLQNAGLTLDRTNGQGQSQSQGGLDMIQHNFAPGPKTGGNKVISPTGEGSGTYSGVNYSQDDLLTVVHAQQQEGIGQAENEFGFDWYGL